MTIPAYPKYRPSGIEWLGKVPTHWIVRQARYMFTLQRGHDLPSEKMVPGKYPVQGSNGVVGYHNQCTTAAPGVTVGRSGSVGKVNYIDRPFWAHNTALFVKDFRGLPPRFIFYLLKALDTERLAAGSAVGTLDRNKIHSQYVASPTAAEAAGICSFLDHETAKIDALIREQERLIELLQEKRQAVISHAVTKGLDPNVPMKDSGVEWLGEVPAHWDIVAIKWLSPVLRGASPRPIDDPIYFDDQGEYAWVRIADVSASNGVLTNTTQQLSGLGASLSVKLEPGAMFLSIAGTVGKPCITKIKACIHDGFVYFPRLEIPPKFLYRVFESGLCYGGLGKMGTQLNLNTETVGGIKIGVPPIQEIEEILVFVSDRLSRFDGLIEEAKLASSLLQERRSALISAAVTGKIDVRDWQPPADESAFDEEVRQAGMETTA